MTKGLIICSRKTKVITSVRDTSKYDKYMVDSTGKAITESPCAPLDSEGFEGIKKYGNFLALLPIELVFPCKEI